MDALIRITLITLLLGLAACVNDRTEAPADGALPDPGAEEVPSTRARLRAEPVTLPAVPQESTVTVSVRLPQVEAAGSRTELEALAGEVRLAAPKNLVIEELELSLEDAVVSASRLPPHGLRLTDIRLTADGPTEAPVRWFGDGDEGYAQTEVVFWLDWNLVPLDDPEGEPWPLDRQRVEGVTLDVHVTTDRHGNLLAEITGSTQDWVWSWGELAEMTDAEIQLLAIETVEPAEEEL